MASTGPIHSCYDDDPEHTEAIDGFVLALAERVDELQDLEAGGDFRSLEQRAAHLATDAERCGYLPLRRSAEEVGTAAQERNGEIAHKALVELTDVARRVRQGHRGAL
ncbi:MAG: hypothetical protein AAF430_21865 [Myxococcota bacterium]